MKGLATVFFIPAWLLGCTTMTWGNGSDVVTEYADLERSVGSKIRVVGIVSQTHGASGLYMNSRDLRLENARCISPRPFNGLAHGERVTLSGFLERSDCGKGRICLNVCDQYVLHREPVTTP